MNQRSRRNRSDLRKEIEVGGLRIAEPRFPEINARPLSLNGSSLDFGWSVTEGRPIGSWGHRA
jgi:hypothetical protein